MKPLIVLMTIGLAGCVSVNSSVLMDRSAYPVPQPRVQVLLPSDTVPADCERVALLHGSGGEIWTNEADMWDKLREETGLLGGNVVQLVTMEDPGWGERLLAGIEHADRDAEAIALWCPSVDG